MGIGEQNEVYKLFIKGMGSINNWSFFFFLDLKIIGREDFFIQYSPLYNYGYNNFKVNY